MGGGGGGGAAPPSSPPGNGNGANGGAGLVVIRAPNTLTFTVAPGTNSVAPVGSCTVATFTVTGTLTIS